MFISAEVASAERKVEVKVRVKVKVKFKTDLTTHMHTLRKFIIYTLLYPITLSYSLILREKYHRANRVFAVYQILVGKYIPGNTK